MILTEATRNKLQPVGAASSDILSLELIDGGRKFRAVFYNAEREDYRYPSQAAYRLMRAIPESRRMTERPDEGLVCIFGATDHTAEVIDTAWPADQVKMDPDARIMMASLKMLRFRQNKCAEWVSEFKERKTIPDHQLDYLEDVPLINFQQVAAHCSMDTEGYALLMEQGCGKTYTTIARMMTQAAQNTPEKPIDIYKSIVVCPKHLRMNWVDEICNFATRQGRVTRLFGNKLRRSRQILDFLQFDEGDEFATLVCSYEQLVSNWANLAMIPWDLAVLDESQAIKNKETRRCEYMWKLRDRAKSRMLLTGTFIANSLMDSYAQLEFLGEGWSGFTSFDAFKSFYGVYDTDGGGIKKLAGYQNIPFFKERLARSCFIITQEEALPELPECVHDVVECDISPEQADVYEQAATQMAVEIDGIPDAALEINNILTKILRLSQVTAGFLHIEETYRDDGSVARPGMDKWFDPTPKLDLLVELLRDHPKDEKAIIWCNWVPAIELIQQRLNDEGLKCVSFYGQTSEAQRQKAVDAFNLDPDVRFFVANPSAGGTGLNLLGYDKLNPEAYDTDCTWNIFYSKSWSSIEYRQAAKRSHRKGTRRPVRITTMVTPGTIDETVHHRVNAKIEHANDVQDLREILSEVFSNLGSVIHA